MSSLLPNTAPFGISQDRVAMLRRLALRFYVGVSISWYLLVLYFVRPAHADFTAFFTGATLLARGRGEELYSLGVQAEIQHQLTSLVFEGGVLPFLHPPYIAELFLPLTGLSLAWAYYLWVGLLWLLLLLVFLWVRKYYAQHLQIAFPKALAVLLLFPPVPRSVLLGQFSIVLLLLLWWAFVSWREDRWIALGLALGLTAFKPQIAAYFGIGLLVERRWRAILIAVATQVLLWYLSITLVGTGSIFDYIEMLRLSGSTANTLGIQPAQMPNIRGLLAYVGIEPITGIYIAFLTWIGGLLLSVWIWTRARLTTAGRYAITLVFTVVLSPHLNVHDVTLLWLALVCTDIFYRQRGEKLDLRGFYILGLAWTLKPLLSQVSARLYLSSVVDSLATWTWGAAIIVALWLPTRPFSHLSFFRSYLGSFATRPSTDT